MTEIDETSEVYNTDKVGDLQSVIHSTVFILFILGILSTLNISVYLRPSLNIDMSVSLPNKTLSWSPLYFYVVLLSDTTVSVRL